MSTSAMDELAEFDIVIKKGADFVLDLALEDESGVIDLTGYSFKSQVKSPDGVLWLELFVTPISLTAGTISLFASASATRAITATETSPRAPSRYAIGNWDLFGAASATTATLDSCFLQGQAKIYPRISVRS